MHKMEEQFSFHYRISSDSSFWEVFHAHPQMEFSYVHAGHGDLIVEGKRYRVEPNTLMVFHPFQLHRVQMDISAEQPFIRTVLMFEPSPLKKYWSAFPLLKAFFEELLLRSSGEPWYGIAETSPLALLLKQFKETREQLAADEQAEEEEDHFLLLELLRQLKAIRQKPGSQSTLRTRRPSHRAEEMMEWIEQHYQEPFRLEQMAEALHLSRYHVVHLFKQATGSTIMDYTKATRVRHACLYLIETTLTVPEIATRVGMGNPSYFCKVFRQQMGHTPHQYRLHIQRRK
ncbi:AraC-like ligand binding domain-containing protein [Paenibacillus algorifonticola]|uniref:AraC-like ligand binding domain-containing protein n=2 Tax=Paenibacillus algorifonticola TaxID=684063 RepID=A0A1I2HS54_9BACL|nr:AraC-like ligand binding domain-containing protein [Paenibacillus algorifonticola]